MKTKKSIVCIIMALSLIIGASTSALAAESDVWARWYTGNAGSANGKHNGVYHHLDSGNAYLSGYVNGATTQYPVVAVLYEDKILFDKKYGTVKIKINIRTVLERTRRFLFLMVPFNIVSLCVITP